MTVYNANNNVTLLLGASDPENDPMTIRRINGAVISSWPHTVTLPVGTASVTQSGVVTYDDGGDTSGHPTGGATQDNGSFNFTIWDGQDESPIYLAQVDLSGTSSPVGAGVTAVGWRVSNDAGTAGDLFVSPSGSASGPGTVGSPYQTVNQAVAALGSGGGVIRVRAGTYREKINLTGRDGTSSTPLEIRGYGTEKPTITGADILTGLAQCSSADASVLGSLGVNGSPVYKVTINKSNFAWGDTGGLSAAAGANLHENGQPMPIATDRADMSDTFFQNEPTRYHSADAMKNNGSTVTSRGSGFNQIQDASVVANYTSAQLANAFVRVHAAPNVVTSRGVSSASGDTLTMVSQASFEATTNYWALANILPNLQPGTWGFVDHGSTVTLYVRPNNAANIASGIEYSTRNHAIYANCSHLKITDMRLVQGGGLLNTDAYSIGMNTSGAAVRRSNHTYDNLYIGGIDGTSSTDRPGGIQAYRVDGHVIRNVTFENIANGFGVNMGDLTDQRSYYIHAYRVGLAPLRQQGVRNQIIGYALYDYCGRGSHSNLGNWYSGCHNNWLHGLKARNCVGYWTEQTNGKTWVTTSQVTANAAHPDNRAMNQDGDGTGANASGPLDNWRSNNWILPDKNQPVDGACMSLGKGSNKRFHIQNNVINGGGIQNAAARLSETHNIYTDLEWNQTSGSALYPPTLNASNVVLVAHQSDAAGNAAAYANVSAGDFTPVANQFFTKTGTSLAALEADLKGVFSAAEVDALLPFDLLGKAWPNMAAPTCHCYTDANDFSV